MKGYLIFESHARADMIKQINEALKRGVVPVGGISVVPQPASHECMFYQAMVKEETL